jgi:16S rRNA (adenine1518-N6/adenine1519-N6)-dimethyltransferase
MAVVKAKKNLGQHFLTDQGIAHKIVESLSPDSSKVLEIGPGMGVLTQYLLESKTFQTVAIDVDRESVEYLKAHFPAHSDKFIHDDFLRIDIDRFFDADKFSIIGNFPYNISSQIFFKVLEHKDRVNEVVCMLQKEVAERLASKPGKKAYGILSVLLQAYYNIEYLFTVHEHVFQPPPKVKSAVIKVTRNQVSSLGCNEVLFKQVIKAAFNQRRKMIRNSLKTFFKETGYAYPFLEKRPEQLSVAEFIELTNAIENA